MPVDRDIRVREYLRVSSDRSGQGKSPDQQHEEMAERAQQLGWTLHPSPYRDDNRSASRYATKSRESFGQLLQDLENDTFDANTLGIWESSRGSRKTSEWLELIELCHRRGIRIWVKTHDRTYDPAKARDRRSLREDASDSEYESDKTSERIQRDVRANAVAGRPHGKQLYGYRRIYDPQTGHLAEVTADPKQAPVVQEAARRALAGESFYAIARDLNARGVPPRRPKRSRTRSEEGWTPVAVKQMLSMPAYAGLRQHRGQILEGVETLWEPLIDRADWEKLQTEISQRGMKRTNDWPAVHLLSGIAACGLCGSTLRVGRQNAGPKLYDDHGNALPRAQYLTYVCSGIPGKTAFHVTIRETHLDEMVTAVVLERLQLPDFLARLNQSDGALDDEREELLSLIATKTAYLEDVHRLAAEASNINLVITQESLVRPQIEAAQKKLQDLARADPRVLALAGADDIPAAWHDLSLPTKRQVIRLLVVPQVHRVAPADRGRRGLNPDRVSFAWW